MYIYVYIYVYTYICICVFLCVTCERGVVIGCNLPYDVSWCFGLRVLTQIRTQTNTHTYTHTHTLAAQTHMQIFCQSGVAVAKRRKKMPETTKTDGTHPHC